MKVKIADFIADFLVDNGVKYNFTVPGGDGTAADPGTDGTAGSGTDDWPLDPVTGEPLPPETVYPDGTADPGTVTDPPAGEETGSGGSTGETAPETDPGLGDGDFTIIAPPPAA